MENTFSSENNGFEHVLCGSLIFYIATVEAILNHTLDDIKHSKQELSNCQLLDPHPLQQTWSL